MNNMLQATEHRLMPILPRQKQDSWTLFYCTQGCAKFCFDNLELACHAGEMAVIPPETPYAHPRAEACGGILLSIGSTALSLHAPMLFRDDENQSLLHLFRDAVYLFHSAAAYRASLLPAYGQLISQHIISRCASSPRSQLVAEIVQSIQQNYTNPNYELDELLRSAPYCYDYLCRLFRQELHTTPHKYLMELRLQAAANALRSGNSSITETARMCGYHDPLYFSRMFKKKYGVSPREYARQAEA